MNSFYCQERVFNAIQNLKAIMANMDCQVELNRMPVHEAAAIRGDITESIASLAMIHDRLSDLYTKVVNSD